jgi:hypothetical protein
VPSCLAELAGLRAGAPGAAPADHASAGPVSKPKAPSKGHRPSARVYQYQRGSNGAACSGFRGVVKRRLGRWKAHVGLHGCQVDLGAFDTKEKAAAAYDSSARRHCGLKAVWNYDIQVDADEAIREVSEMAVLDKRWPHVAHR